jgi:hypothetical protein
MRADFVCAYVRHSHCISAIFSVVPRMSAIGILLVLITYIFAVMVTILFKDLYADGYTDENYFSSLDLSIFTLFQIMTMDNWADVTRQAMDAYIWAWLPLMIYLILTALIVVNLIIAVICDAISQLNDDGRLDGSGDAASVSSSEHPAIAENPEDVKRQLVSLESQVAGLKHEQDELMKSLHVLANQVRQKRELK